MKWNNAKQGLPKESGRYLVYIKYSDKLSRIEMMEIYRPKPKYYWYYESNITHWMKVEPPKENNERLSDL